MNHQKIKFLILRHSIVSTSLKASSWSLLACRQNCGHSPSSCSQLQFLVCGIASQQGYAGQDSAVAHLSLQFSSCWSRCRSLESRSWWPRWCFQLFRKVFLNRGCCFRLHQNKLPRKPMKPLLITSWTFFCLDLPACQAAPGRWWQKLNPSTSIFVVLQSPRKQEAMVQLEW